MMKDGSDAMKNLTLIFGKDTWPYTSAARKDYEQQGRPFQYLNVIQDSSAMKKMLEYSRGQRDVPVIVEGETVTIGYNGGSWEV